jgi:hypothetical protein
MHRALPLRRQLLLPHRSQLLEHSPLEFLLLLFNLFRPVCVYIVNPSLLIVKHVNCSPIFVFTKAVK